MQLTLPDVRLTLILAAQSSAMDSNLTAVVVEAALRFVAEERHLERASALARISTQLQEAAQVFATIAGAFTGVGAAQQKHHFAALETAAAPAPPAQDDETAQALDVVEAVQDVKPVISAEALQLPQEARQAPGRLANCSRPPQPRAGAPLHHMYVYV